MVFLGFFAKMLFASFWQDISAFLVNFHTPMKKFALGFFWILKGSSYGDPILPWILLAEKMTYFSKNETTQFPTRFRD